MQIQKWSTCHKPNTDLLMVTWKCSETSHSMMCTYLDKKAISTSHGLLLSRKFYLPWSMTIKSWKLPWPQAIPPLPPTNQTGPSKEYKFSVVCVPWKTNKLHGSSDISNKDVLFCWSLTQCIQQHFLRVKTEHTNPRKNFAITVHYFYSTKALMK
jgi:hypothetical protein